MRYTVRLYATPEQEQRATPCATVVLTDQPEDAGWLPERLAAEARVFLERVDTADAEVAECIRTVLQQPSVRVAWASAHRTGAVRTRGDYTAAAPYGPPAYWRAVIGQLPSQAGLRYDLQDYAQLLEAMDAAVSPAVAPAPAVMDRSAVLRQCSLYLLRQGREGLWAGKATYAAAQQQWTVPVHDTASGTDIAVGEMVVDARGVIRHARLPDLVVATAAGTSRALDDTGSARSLPQRLVAALRRLAAVRQDLAPRLQAWWEQVERGVTPATEAAIRAILTAGRESTVEVLAMLSHRSLQADYAPAGLRNIRTRGEITGVRPAPRTLTITTDAVLGVRMTVEGDNVVVGFLDWQGATPPLVVLVPEDEGHAPQTPVLVAGESGMWTARFESVPPGAYLLALAPPGV